MTSILIVDDEEILARTIAKYLSKRGYEVHAATDAHQAWQLFEQEQPSFCLIDYRLGTSDGVDLLTRMKDRRPHIHAVMMTGYGDMKVAVSAMKAGARDFLVKPVPLASIESMVSELLQPELPHESKVGAASILGRSSAAIEIRAAVGRIVAATRDLNQKLPSILITGESGTGKDVVARAIHKDGARADGPMVSVNCASLPTELIESELFGHVKGAFTDARSDKTGLFEAARGGVLFLDEIGDMPLAAQAKLLRVLESQTIRPVGSNRDVDVDVWVIAATNQSLSSMVAQGTFRADLMFRLQVLWLDLPALRARDSDVLLLAMRFLEEFAAKYGRPVKQLTPDARVRLVKHQWPGNIRELRNVIERAVLLCPQEQIDADHLHFGAPAAEPAVVAPDRPTTLPEAEVQLLSQALERANGNVSRAASALGITRDTMRYRMEKYGLSR